MHNTNRKEVVTCVKWEYGEMSRLTHMHKKKQLVSFFRVGKSLPHLWPLSEGPEQDCTTSSLLNQTFSFLTSEQQRFWYSLSLSLPLPPSTGWFGRQHGKLPFFSLPPPSPAHKSSLFPSSSSWCAGRRVLLSLGCCLKVHFWEDTFFFFPLFPSSFSLKSGPVRGPSSAILQTPPPLSGSLRRGRIREVIFFLFGEMGGGIGRGKRNCDQKDFEKRSWVFRLI